MQIHFIHDGIDSAANLHYNFEEIEDSVLVRFNDKINEDILFSMIDGEWHSVSDLQTRNPATYKNIQQAIQKYFRLSGFFNDFNFQRHMS